MPMYPYDDQEHSKIIREDHEKQEEEEYLHFELPEGRMRCVVPLLLASAFLGVLILIGIVIAILGPYLFK